MRTISESKRKYLQELAKRYPNRNALTSEIINLNAILNLPKGTEHFLSDIHGEHEAYRHLRRNASGVIRHKIEILFGQAMNAKERAELATLVYYPRAKLDELRSHIADLDAWYRDTILKLLEICRLVSSKYTRSKVRKHLAKTAEGFEYIMTELLNNDVESSIKENYYENILNTIISIGASEAFIEAVCASIKSLVIDHLHIVGDIYDRGPRADIVLDEMMKENSLDIQWGNHDVLWLGAASGSRACIAAALNNSITYKNLDVVEIGYGISLRPLSFFANEVYANSDVSNYLPKGNSQGDFLRHDDDMLIARMHKAISVIQFKLEGQIIKRNPQYDMDDRLFLDKIDFVNKTVLVYGKRYPMRDCDFPTVDPKDPYRLTEREEEVMLYLKNAFLRSEKLQRHATFLFEKGEMYTIFNRNLLFHGSIPLTADKQFMALTAAEGRRGRALMDYCDKMARQGYFARDGAMGKRRGKDFLWFLWCGKNSPLCAREKITTFERLFIDDSSTWEEPKNAYYHCWDDSEIADAILSEFGLGGSGSHIINGHIPVQQRKGEAPVKAGGRVIVIDGGFCKAYQPTTGIAGYTLIYNAEGIRISAHEPFRGTENAIKNNVDIISDTVVFEHAADKICVRDTDIGREISEKIEDLTLLLQEYEAGNL